MAPYVPTPALVTSRDPAGNQAASDITALASGGYVVTWTDQPTTDARTIRARVYDAGGRPTSDEIAVGTGIAARTTALADGGFAIAFLQAGAAPADGTAILARSYGPTGVPLAGPVPVGGIPPLLEGESLGPFAFTALSDGRVVAAWSVNMPAPRYAEGTGWIYPKGTAYGSIATLDGSYRSATIKLSESSGRDINSIISIALAPLQNSGFALARETYYGAAGFSSSGSSDVQLFDRTGSPATDIKYLGSNGGTPVSAVALNDGRVAVGYVGSSSAFRTISADGSLSPERSLGPAAYGYHYATQGYVSLSRSPDGNLFAQYTLNVGVEFGNAHFPINAVSTDLVSPDGAKIANVALGGGAGGAIVALAQGDYAYASTQGSAGQGDVLTRVYQSAAVTSDPDGLPLVGDAFYNSLYPDVARAGIDPEHHYATAGWIEGRNPDPLFSTAGYRSANVDVARAEVDPLQHYDGAGWREGRDPSIAFDTQLYLARNPDVAAAGVDPLAHYLQSGRAEGREIYASIGRPGSIINGSFDAEYYLLANPDVGASARAQGGDVFETAYRHYDTNGWREGRNPNAYFDTNAYLTAYQDVKAADINPLMHYDTSGWREGRDPSGGFDTSNYLVANPDVRAAGVDPLRHFLTAGALEGRAPLGDGTFE